LDFEPQHNARFRTSHILEFSTNALRLSIYALDVYHAFLSEFCISTQPHTETFVNTEHPTSEHKGLPRFVEGFEEGIDPPPFVS
jgi:hypothetical protein